MTEFVANKYRLELGKKTYVMGILNVTPDSFSDGGKYTSLEAAVNRAFAIKNQGADIIDIGAQSTRPGYELVSPKEELKRLLPVLEALNGKLNIPISIDTFYPEVAEQSLNYGADIINDVMGFDVNGMLKLAANSNCGLVMVHGESSVESIKPFFMSKFDKALEYSIDKKRLCFDPGIGFGKNYEDDIQAIKKIGEYRIQDCAILVGASRKRLIGHFCDSDSMRKRLSGTIAAHTVAILNGADIIRVHDVNQAVNAARLADQFKSLS